MAVSQLAKQEWHAFYGIKLSQISVLNNCVDSARFIPRPGLTSSTINILFVGRLDPGKGLDKLRQLAELIKNQQNKYKLTIICNNPNNSDYFVKLSQVEVKIGLNLEQIKLEYPYADVMYFPSLYEGFEMVTLEALSSGVPVLGNRVGAVAELAGQNFPGVAIINPQRDLLSQIDELALAYTDFSVKQELHQKVQEQFSIANYKQQLSTILQQI